MKKNKTITIDEVVYEWFRGETYTLKSMTGKTYPELISNFDSNEVNKNQNRKDTLITGIPNLKNLIDPLYKLPFTWYQALIETYEEFDKLYTCCSTDWLKITVNTFQLKNTLNNLNSDLDRKARILERKEYIKKNGKFPEKLIMVGSSEERLTMIDGNHRAIAYLLEKHKTGFDFLPLEIIYGISSLVSEYPFSFEYWENYIKVSKRTYEF